MEINTLNEFLLQNQLNRNRHIILDYYSFSLNIKRFEISKNTGCDYSFLFIVIITVTEYSYRLS